MHQARTLLWAMAAALLMTTGCSEPVPTTPLERAHQALQSAQWDEAIDACNVTLGSDRDNARAYILRARAYQGRHDFEKALADFNDAIRLAPKMPEAYYSRAVLYRKLGRDKDALADDVKGRQIDANYHGYVELDKRDKVRTDAAAIAEARRAARESVKKDKEAESHKIPVTSTRFAPAKVRPKGDSLEGLFTRQVRPSGRSPRVVRDAFGLPIDTSVGGVGFNSQTTFATPDGAPGQWGTTPGGLPGDNQQGDANARTAGRSAAPDRGTAQPKETADESAFEDDGEGPGAGPSPARRKSDRANPYARQGRTPFSGSRTTAYRGTDADEPTVPQERGSRRTRARSDEPESGSQADSGRPNPFGRPAATPFSGGARRRVTENDDLAE